MLSSSLNKRGGFEFQNFRYPHKVSHYNWPGYLFRILAGCHSDKYDCCIKMWSLLEKIWNGQRCRVILIGSTLEPGTLIINAKHSPDPASRTREQTAEVSLRWNKRPMEWLRLAWLSGAKNYCVDIWAQAGAQALGPCHLTEPHWLQWLSDFPPKKWWFL